MADSVEYTILENRINQLKKHFDFQQELTGPDVQQQDIRRGFRVLCHAEFEDYFESIAKRIFRDSLEIWQNNQIANYQLASFFILQDPIQKADNISAKITSLTQKYHTSIKDNNGIKRHIIQTLFVPLGYELSDFEDILLTELDEFGQRRGETAHKSARQTTTALDKYTEFQRVDHLLELLKGFEDSIRAKYASL